MTDDGFGSWKGAAVDRAKFAERIVVSNLKKGRLGGVFQILRALTDRAVGIKNVPLPNACGTGYGDMANEARSASHLDLRADVAEWPDLNIGVQNRRGVDDRAGMDFCHLSTRPKSRIPSETTSPLTKQRQEALPRRFLALVSSHSMKSVSPGMTGLRNLTSSALMK